VNASMNNVSLATLRYIVFCPKHRMSGLSRWNSRRDSVFTSAKAGLPPLWCRQYMCTFSDSEPV